MMKMNLDTQSNSAWYRGQAFDDAQLVTSEASNPALGITRITFEAPRDQKQTDAGVLANVRVNYGRVSFRGSIWAGKNGKTIRFSPEQRKTVQIINGKEESRYIDLIQMDSCVVAQILRYAETFMVVEQETPEEQAAKAEAKRLEIEEKKRALAAELAALEAPVVSGNMQDLSAAFAAGGKVDNGEEPF